MFVNNISQSLTAAQKTSLQGAVTTMSGIFTWFINLTPADRKKILKMGSKSESFVRAVLQGLLANPTAAGSLDVAEFQKDMTLWDDLVAFNNLLTVVFEGLQDTMMVLGSELMQQGNAGYALIKEAAKTNTALTTLAQDLGQRYKKAGSAEPTVFTLPANGHAVINGTVPGRQVKLLSGGPVTIYKGEFANGKNKVVNIDNPVKLPAGWNTIHAANNSTTEPAIILIAQL